MTAFESETLHPRGKRGSGVEAERRAPAGRHDTNQGRGAVRQKGRKQQAGQKGESTGRGRGTREEQEQREHQQERRATHRGGKKERKRQDKERGEGYAPGQSAVRSVRTPLKWLSRWA
jgi:hypothetical protein